MPSNRQRELDSEVQSLLTSLLLSCAVFVTAVILAHTLSVFAQPVPPLPTQTATTTLGTAQTMWLSGHDLPAVQVPPPQTVEYTTSTTPPAPDHPLDMALVHKIRRAMLPRSFVPICSHLARVALASDGLAAIADEEFGEKHCQQYGSPPATSRGAHQRDDNRRCQRSVAAITEYFLDMGLRGEACGAGQPVGLEKWGTHRTSEPFSFCVAVQHWHTHTRGRHPVDCAELVTSVRTP